MRLGPRAFDVLLPCRHWPLLLTFALAIPSEALAQRPNRSNSQFTLRREEAGAADATLARQHVRTGDCARALNAFDSAIRSSSDPTLRRDRGLCHEKLGHPYPAIDDLRAYLTERPEAPDADQIRQHLSQLEAQVAGSRPTRAAVQARE